MEQGLQAASDTTFPDATFVYARDVYNETQSSAEGEITATAISPVRHGGTAPPSCPETIIGARHHSAQPL